MFRNTALFINSCIAMQNNLFKTHIPGPFKNPHSWGHMYRHISMDPSHDDVIRPIHGAFTKIKCTKTLMVCNARHFPGAP